MTKVAFAKVFLGLVSGSGTAGAVPSGGSSGAGHPLDGMWNVTTPGHGSACVTVGPRTLGAVVPSSTASGSLTPWTDVTPVDEDQRVLVSQSGTAVGGAGPVARDGETTWELGPLTTGRYDVWWAYGARGFPRRFVSAVDVLAGQQQRIHVTPPTVVEMPGAFEGWKSLPLHWRPQLLVFEGKSAAIDEDGLFSLRIAMPLAASPLQLSFRDRAPPIEGVGELQLSVDENRLVVRLPHERMSTVTVLGRGGFLENPVGDVESQRVEYWVRLPADSGPCLFRVDETTSTRLGEDAALRIPRTTGETLVGCLLSWDASGGGHGLPLGFFEATPDMDAVEVSSEGRSVSVVASGPADVTLIWDSPSGHEVQCALGTMDLSGSSIWCPRDADRLILRDARGVRVLDVREPPDAEADSSVIRRPAGSRPPAR